jgi:hypothetical protein
MPLTLAQIEGAYQAVLQRAPTNAEVTTSQSLGGTIGYSGAIAAIVDSPEAQQNVYPIVQIILLATGNWATPAQLAAWVPAVESGTSLNQMALAFVASTEFADTYNDGVAVDPNAPITAQILSTIIQNATGLTATPDQISSWLSTGLSIDQVFVDFALSAPTAGLEGAIQYKLTGLAEN